MEIHIRPGSAEEIPELIALQTLSLKTFYINEYESTQIAALVDSQAEARKLGGETILVAEVDMKIVGFAALSDIVRRINAVYIHPDWMRQGIGKQLLTSLEEIAVQRRYRVLQVITSSTASLFYQSQSYEIQRPFGFWAQSKIYIPCQLLTKRLLPPLSVWGWIYRYRLIILLLIGLGLVISIDSFHKQNTQPQHDSPSQSIESP